MERDYADNPASTVAPGQKPASDLVMDIFAAIDEFELDFETKMATESRNGAD